MKSNFERIGDHIRLVDERNRDESIKTLLGLTIEKVFIPSVANTIGSDMANYKVIRRGQFACSLMQVRRDKRMPVALLDEIDEAIISQAYPVFQIKDSGRLDPEYLMMWFRRPEFDREACFHAVGGVRGSLEWEDFCNLRLPVPSPEKQREIVAEYETVVKRIALNEKMGRKLEETAQAIYKHWFVDFEFPMSAEDAKKLGKPELEGKPYQSSGGEMVFCELLEKKIPTRWAGKKLDSICKLSAGGDKPSVFSSQRTERCNIPIYSNSMIDDGLFGFTSSSRIAAKCVTVSARGGIGFTALRLDPFVPIVRLIVAIPNAAASLNYLYRCVSKLNHNGASSAQAQLTVPQFAAISVTYPNHEILEKFQSFDSALVNQIQATKTQKLLLKKLAALLLSRMALEDSDSVKEL